MNINTNRWNRIRYSCWAPFYDWVARPVTERCRRRAIELAALQPGERVLIVGAGTGLDLEFIAEGPIITATDLTPAMLEKLRQRARRRGLNVDTQVMDGQALMYRDESFDVVLLHFILAVIPDPQRCAREAARVLRPQGRVVILDKFLQDETRPPLLLRLLGTVFGFIASELTRKLGPILAGSGLRIVKQEGVALGGFVKITVAGRESLLS